MFSLFFTASAVNALKNQFDYFPLMKQKILKKDYRKSERLIMMLRVDSLGEGVFEIKSDDSDSSRLICQLYWKNAIFFFKISKQKSKESITKDFFKRFWEH